MKEGYALYYRGKKIDTFALAINQMLEFAGLPTADFIDCVGCRSFGYRFSGNVREWFRPAVTPEKAVLRIAEEFEIPFKCVKAKVVNREKELQSGAVLGPLRQGIAVQGIQEYYYMGEGVYLFVKEAEEGRYQIFDPRGFPGLLVSLEDLGRLIGGEECHMFFCEQAVRHMRVPDRQRIVKAGMELHERIADKENLEAENAVSCLTGGLGEQLSYKYAVQNFLLQTDEIFRLISEENMLDARTKRTYVQMKQKFYDISENGGMKELPVMLREIWRLLKNGTGF